MGLIGPVIGGFIAVYYVEVIYTDGILYGGLPTSITGLKSVPLVVIFYTSILSQDIEEMALTLEVYDIGGNPRPVDDSIPLKALKGYLVIKQEMIIRIPRTDELKYRQVSASPVIDKEGKI